MIKYIRKVYKMILCELSKPQFKKGQIVSVTGGWKNPVGIIMQEAHLVKARAMYTIMLPEEGLVDLDVKNIHAI